MPRNPGDFGFRSPHLRARAKWPRLPVSRRRLSTLAIVLAVLAAGSALVYFRVPPKDSWGFPLYWLHDYLYLPFIGYAWTLFFPYSLMWWAMGAVLAVIGLVTFTTRRSAIHRVHAWLCWFAVKTAGNSDGLARLLIASVDWFARMGFGAELLESVTRLEHVEGLLALVDTAPREQASAGKALRLIRLTRVLGSLRCGPKANLPARLWALVLWQQCAVWIERRYGGEKSEEFAEVASALRECFQALVKCARVEQVPARKSLLEAWSLLWDIEALAPSEAGPMADSVLGMLADRVGARLSEVRSILQHLEDIGRIGSRTRLPDFTPDVETQFEVLEPTGVLSVGIALHLALRAGQPELGLAYLETFDALRLTSRVADRERYALAAAMAQNLTREAPRPDQYRLARELQALRLEQLRTELQRNGMYDDPVAEALKLEAGLQLSLDYASGIDFGSAGMQAAWPEQTGAIRQRILHRIRRRPIPLRRRVDIVLASSAVAGLILYFLVGAILISFAQTRQWFDPWTQRLLADRRVLVNIRDHLAEAPLLDAVLHQPDGKIYMSQADGSIHSYSPATGLWSTDKPFTPHDMADPTIRLLASAPGLSESGDAPSDAELWGVTSGGGLVRKNGGRWEVVIGDSRFIGISGRPVEHKDLTSVAVSADENWLVAGTANEGFGVYDLRLRRWVSPVEIGVGKVPAAAAHVIWWRDRFWIGGKEGLSHLVLNRKERTFRTFAKLTGDVLNLDSTAEALWVLQKKRCVNSAQFDCLTLAKVPTADGDPVMLLDQRNRFGGQTLDNFFFAEEWNGKLVLAGYDGIFSYDPRFRTWSRHVSAKVNAFTRCQDRPCFYFAYPSTIGRFSPDNLQGAMVPTWHIAGESITRIAAGADRAMVLTLSGRAFALEANSNVTPVGAAYSGGVDPSRFDRAVKLGDDVLFLGAAAAQVHNISSRTYEQLANTPPWMRQASTILRGADSGLYALVPVGAGYVERFFNQERIHNDDFRIPNQNEPTIDGPIILSPDSDSQGIRVIDGRSRVIQINGTNLTYLSGGKNAALDGAHMLDVAPSAHGVLLSTDRGVVEYANATRSLSKPLETPEGEKPRQIADYGALMASTESGRLVSLGPDPRVLVGAGSLAMTDDTLSDVFPTSTQIFLGGNGAVQSYSPATRAIDRTWSLDAANSPVSIKAVIKGEPLTLSGGVARFGATVLDREVASMFLDDTSIWMVAGPPGQRYLHAIPLRRDTPRAKPDPKQAAKPVRPAVPFCEYRNPTAGPGVTQVHDARQLPSGVIATTTNQGLRFYSAERGSWYSYDLGPGLGQGDLYAIGDTLLVADPARHPTTLTIATRPILPDDTCALGPVGFKNPPQSMKIQSLAVNERTGQLVVVDETGAVLDLTGGSLHTVLDTPGTGPPADQIVRSWYFPDVDAQVVWVATKDQVWRYALDSGQWSQLAFDVEDLGGLSADLTVDLQPSLQGISIVARHTNGDLFNGQYEARDGSKRIALRRAYRAGEGFFAARGEDILDVQQIGASWTFVMNNGVREYDPRLRMWKTLLTIDNGDRVGTHGHGGENDVLTATSASGRPVWWVRRGSAYNRYELQAGEVTGLGAQGRIYRLDPSGVLRTCELDRNPAQPWNCSAGVAPLELAASRVKQAFVVPVGGGSSTELILFDTGSRLIAHSAVRGGEVPLNADAQSFTGIASARWLHDRLWLRSGNRLLILQAIGDQVVTQVQTGVQDFSADDRQNVYVRLASGWRMWDPLARPAGGLVPIVSGVQLRVFAMDGGRATAVDGSGLLYALRESGEWGQGDFRLPANIDPTQVRALIRGLASDWWVVSGAVLTHVESVGCGPAGPPPGLSACPRVLDVWKLSDPANQVVRAVLGLRDIEITTADGVALRARPGSEVQASKVTLPLATGILKDRFAEFQPFFRNVGGREVYDPISTLKETPRGLVAVRPSGEESLGTGAGGMTPQPYPALDVEWMRWDRGAQKFIVRSSTGEIAYDKRNFVRSGRLLFEGVEALRCFNLARCQEANAGGVWEFGSWREGLASKQIQFTPISWTLPIESMSGRFRSGNIEYAVNGSQVDQRPVSNIVQGGAVTFFRQVRRGLLAAIQTVDGRSLMAYRNGRFLWDSGRRGVALDKRGLLLWTDAGIHFRSSLQSFDYGPAGAPSPQDEMASGPEEKGLFFRGGRWYERAATGAWQPVNSRIEGATFEEAGLRWERRNGAVNVTYVVGGANAVTLNHGFGFRTDAVSDAASYGGNLFLATGAAFEIRKFAGAGPPWVGDRLPAIPADRLETFHVPGDVERLYRTSGGAVTEWNASSRSFERSPRNPYAERLMVEAGRMRFSWTHGVVRKEFRVENARGEVHWAPYSFDHERFPFDVIQSVASWNGELYLGTPVGLQVLAGTGLESLKRIFDMGAPGTAAVTRIGRPCDAPTELVATSEAHCFQAGKDGHFQACTRADPLSCQALVKTAFWTWTGGANGISGRYEVSNAEGGADTSNLPIDLRGGCFPHDNPNQASSFDSVIFTVWAGNHVSVHAESTMDITTGVKNFAFNADVRLMPVNNPIPLPLGADGELPRGMYLREGGRTWRYTTTWTRVEDPGQLSAIAESDKENIILQRNKLRLSGGNGKPFVFDLRIPGHGWRPIPWKAGGRLAIDIWHNLAFVPGVLWVATPEGLVSFQPSGRFDPDRFRFVAGVPEEGDRPITDVEIDSGNARLRYSGDSTRVYYGSLDDRSATTPFTAWSGSDPFAQRELMTQNHWWHWRQVGRVDNSLGQLQGTFKGEPIALSDGRFDFDAINSIALVRGKLHLASDTRGWFQSPENSAAIAVMERPQSGAIAPLEVSEVRSTRGAQPSICLTDRNGSGVVRLLDGGKSERTKGCIVALGDAGFWRYQYRSDSADVWIVPRNNSTKSAERKLTAGRFADDVVIGAPVASARRGAGTLVPTSSGVARLDRGLAELDLFAPPFQGKPEPPQALHIAADGTPMFAMDGGLFRLDESQSRGYPWAIQLPQGATLNRIERNGRLIVLDWSAEKARHHDLIDPLNPVVRLTDMLLIDIRDLPQFGWRRAQGVQLDPWLSVETHRDAVQVRNGLSKMDPLPLAKPLDLLEGIRWKDRLHLIGRQELLELNINQLTTRTLGQ